MGRTGDEHLSAAEKRRKAQSVPTEQKKLEVIQKQLHDLLTKNSENEKKRKLETSELTTTLKALKKQTETAEEERDKAVEKASKAEEEAVRAMEEALQAKKHAATARIRPHQPNPPTDPGKLY